MARDTGAQCKQCRREGMKLFLKGERCLTDKCGVERRNYPPGDHGRGRSRQSEYRLQLREKQKARRYYGVLEKQFRNYYSKASRQPGVTGENLLRLLESRFDNVLVRLGFAASRRQARQMISHGHWMINGRRVDIPSYQLREDDVITMRPSAPVESVVREATELTSVVPAWLQADHDGLTAKVLRLPERPEITSPVQEQLIVELYSNKFPPRRSRTTAGPSPSSRWTAALATRSATRFAACCCRRWPGRR
jgi:small subunit ribosomal protein S4